MDEQHAEAAGAAAAALPAERLADPVHGIAVRTPQPSTAPSDGSAPRWSGAAAPEAMRHDVRPAPPQVSDEPDPQAS
jgi:hypothetical protein